MEDPLYEALEDAYFIYDEFGNIKIHPTTTLPACIYLFQNIHKAPDSDMKRRVWVYRRTKSQRINSRPKHEYLTLGEVKSKLKLDYPSLEPKIYHEHYTKPLCIPQSAVHLLSLPSEIRNIIYEYSITLESDKSERRLIVAQSRGKLPIIYGLENADFARRDIKIPALLRTCRQIRNEAVAYFYERKTLVFEHSFSSSAFLNQIGPLHRHSLRNICLPTINIDNGTFEFLFSVYQLLLLLRLADCPNLEYLEIPLRIDDKSILAPESGRLTFYESRWRRIFEKSEGLQLLRKFRGLKQVIVLPSILCAIGTQDYDNLYQRVFRELEKWLKEKMVQPKHHSNPCQAELGYEISKKLREIELTPLEDWKTKVRVEGERIWGCHFDDFWRDEKRKSIVKREWTSGPHWVSFWNDWKGCFKWLPERGDDNVEDGIVEKMAKLKIV